MAAGDREFVAADFAEIERRAAEMRAVKRQKRVDELSSVLAELERESDDLKSQEWQARLHSFELADFPLLLFHPPWRFRR